MLEELRALMADEIASTRPEIAAAIRAADAPKPQQPAAPPHPHLRIVK